MQEGEVGLALLLAAAIGLEREWRQKNAGLRTHALVGMGAALFMVVSKYGFEDVLSPGRVVVDPSRVAAQIVTGIGFLGGGLIFVRRDYVHGLTTAATVWLTAAVGAAAGAGLPILAVTTTAGYFVLTMGSRPLVRRLSRSSQESLLRIRYPDGRGTLRSILLAATRRGFAVDEASVPTFRQVQGSDGDRDRPSVVELTLHVRGHGSVTELAAILSDIEGVDALPLPDTLSAD